MEPLHIYMLEDGAEFSSAKQTLAERWNQQTQTEIWHKYLIVNVTELI